MNCTFCSIRDVVISVLPAGIGITSSQFASIASSTQSLDFCALIIEIHARAAGLPQAPRARSSRDILMQDHLDCQTMPVDAQP